MTLLGFPEGSIHWTKEGDSKFTFVGSELRLNEVQLQDNGIYTCSARNILGTGPSSKIQLVVNGMYEFDVFNVF